MSTPSSLVGALAPGTSLFEYRIERVLGHGGFGITYLAQDTHLDKRVAIKEYLPNELAARAEGNTVTMRSEDSREAFDWGRTNFVKEARVLARFSHPNLIQVHRFFEVNGTAYIVMEYAEGTTLAALLKRESILPQDRIRHILHPILNGLEQVHQKGVLHRDIKPDNIILREDGSPVLIDFGAARQNMGSATLSAMNVFTAGYAPLEQYGATGAQGPWTDVYALAAVTYRMVSGKKPMDAVNRLGSSDPVTPAAVVGEGKYAPHFLAAIDWGLAVRSEDRPQNIADWRQALDGIVTPPTAAAAQPKPAPATPTESLPVETNDDAPTAMLAKPAAVSAAVPPAEPVPPPSPAIVPKPSSIKWVAALGLVVLLAGGAAAFFLMKSPKEATPASTAVTAPKPTQDSTTTPTQASSPSAAATAQTKKAPEPIPAPASSSVAAPTSPGKQAKTEPAAPATPASAAPIERREEKSAAEPPPPTAEKPQVEAPAPAPKPKIVPLSKMTTRSTFQDCPHCPVMGVLPSSSYIMGSKSDASGAAAWESPDHKVFIGKAIAMGWFEITTAEWKQCVEAGVCRALKAGPGKGDPGRIPAVNVSWTDAHMYTGWLSEQAGRTYRLPSEAEWEFGIRAGTATSRFWGDDRRGQCDHANGADLSGVKFDSKLPAGKEPCDDGYGALAPAGVFKPNAFGLYDMAGNAWEWTLDCWKDTYAGAPADGAAVDIPGCTKRVIRGGSWRTKPESMRSANRGLSPADARSEDLGFRVVAE